MEQDTIHENKYLQKFVIIRCYFLWTVEFDFCKESKCRLGDTLTSRGGFRGGAGGPFFCNYLSFLQSLWRTTNCVN